MPFLNDSDHFMANVYIHEWILGMRATSSALICFRFVIANYTSRVNESLPHPNDSRQMLRFSSMTCEERIS